MAIPLGITRSLARRGDGSIWTGSGIPPSSELYDLGPIPFTPLWPELPQGVLSESNSTTAAAVNSLAAGSAQRITITQNFTGNVLIDGGTDIEIIATGRTINGSLNFTGDARRIKVVGGHWISPNHDFSYGKDIYYENVFLDDGLPTPTVGTAFQFGLNISPVANMVERFACVGCRMRINGASSGAWTMLMAGFPATFNDLIFANCRLENISNNGQNVRLGTTTRVVYKDVVITGGSNSFRSQTGYQDWWVHNAIIVGNPQLNDVTGLIMDNVNLYRDSGAPATFNIGTASGSVSNSVLHHPLSPSLSYTSIVNGGGNGVTSWDEQLSSIDFTQNGALPTKTSISDYGSDQ